MAQQQFYLKHFQISEQRKRKTWKYIHVFQKFHIKLQNYFSIYFTKQINGPIVFNVLRKPWCFLFFLMLLKEKELGCWELFFHHFPGKHTAWTIDQYLQWGIRKSSSTLIPPYSKGFPVPKIVTAKM
jgi:hypothetical protein